jgi:hypothetical protein
MKGEMYREEREVKRKRGERKGRKEKGANIPGSRTKAVVGFNWHVSPAPSRLHY